MQIRLHRSMRSVTCMCGIQRHFLVAENLGCSVALPSYVVIVPVYAGEMC